MILHVLLAPLCADLLRSMVLDAKERDILLSTALDLAGMWAQLGTAPWDLLVVDDGFLGADPPAELRRIRGLPDPPEIIVLLERDDPERRAELLDAGALACLASDIERHTLLRTVRAMVRQAKKIALQGFIVGEAVQESRLSDFVSRSPAMQRFLTLARKVVGTSSSLLVLGETGVGKEYLVRAIHRDGPRGHRPFVAVNCAALPESLLEAELFGHTAGAFTGAQHARRGYFELGHEGTVFLDEIGELPSHLQIKLLRVLQEHLVQPVGAEKTVQVDVRVVAATNRDIKSDLDSGRFRSDLYYRLGVVTLTVPPLRERREDIPDLLERHIEHFRSTLGRSVFGVQPEALELLLRYSWPGNVRELINVVERAVLLTDGEEISVSDLPEDIAAPQRLPRDAVCAASECSASTRLFERPLHEARDEVLRGFELRYLQQVLTRTRGRIGEAAELAGITERSLYEKMKRLGLRKEGFRDSGLRRP